MKSDLYSKLNTQVARLYSEMYTVTARRAEIAARANICPNCGRSDNFTVRPASEPQPQLCFSRAGSKVRANVARWRLQLGTTEGFRYSLALFVRLHLPQVALAGQTPDELARDVFTSSTLIDQGNEGSA
jgi:hypothetical protein